MSLFDDLTNNMEDFKVAFNKLSNNIKSNSKEIKKQTKLRLEIYKLSKEIDKIYINLGRIFYNIRQGGNYSEDYINNIISELDEKNSHLQSLKLQMDSIDIDFTKEEFIETKRDEEYIYIDEKDLK